MSLQAKRLREAREAAGLSQTEVAKSTGISQAAISRFESGVEAPEAALILFSTIYKASVSELRGGTTYPSAPSDEAGRRRHFWQRNHLIAHPGADPLSDTELDAREAEYMDRVKRIRSEVKK